MKSFMKRLNGLKDINLATCIFSSLLFVFPVISVILGSFPGQFVLFFFFHIGQPIFLMQAAQLLRVEANSASWNSGTHDDGSPGTVGEVANGLSKDARNQQVAVSSIVRSE